MATKASWEVSFWDSTQIEVKGSSKRVARNNAVMLVNTCRNGEQQFLTHEDISDASIIDGNPHSGRKPTRTRSRNRVKTSRPPARQPLPQSLEEEMTFRSCYEVSTIYCRPLPV